MEKEYFCPNCNENKTASVFEGVDGTLIICNTCGSFVECTAYQDFDEFSVREIKLLIEQLQTKVTNMLDEANQLLFRKEALKDLIKDYI